MSQPEREPMYRPDYEVEGPYEIAGRWFRRGKAAIVVIVFFIIVALVMWAKGAIAP